MGSQAQYLIYRLFAPLLIAPLLMVVVVVVSIFVLVLVVLVVVVQAMVLILTVTWKSTLLLTKNFLKTSHLTKNFLHYNPIKVNMPLKGGQEQYIRTILDQFSRTKEFCEYLDIRVRKGRNKKATLINKVVKYYNEFRRGGQRRFKGDLNDFELGESDDDDDDDEAEAPVPAAQAPVPAAQAPVPAAQVAHAPVPAAQVAISAVNDVPMSAVNVVADVNAVADVNVVADAVQAGDDTSVPAAQLQAVNDAPVPAQVQSGDDAQAQVQSGDDAQAQVQSGDDAQAQVQSGDDAQAQDVNGDDAHEVQAELRRIGPEFTEATVDTRLVVTLSAHVPSHGKSVPANSMHRMAANLGTYQWKTVVKKKRSDVEPSDVLVYHEEEEKREEEGSEENGDNGDEGDELVDTLAYRGLSDMIKEIPPPWLKSSGHTTRFKITRLLTRGLRYKLCCLSYSIMYIMCFVLKASNYIP